MDMNCGCHDEENIKTNGLLQIALYICERQLFVHIIQGKDLRFCNSVVRIALLPDEDDVTSCRSKVISNNKFPVYDEKFAYKLDILENYHRLYISSWHIPNQNELNGIQFLGCMSFGLKNILNDKKFINGWYYLLNDKVGRKKHLKLSTVSWSKACSKSQPNLGRGYIDWSDKSSATTSGSSNPENLWSDLHTLIIPRSANGGFGFTLESSRPTKVCYVDDHSHAIFTGLKKSDELFKVNGLDVYHCSTQEVADIIRAWRHGRLTVEIKRPFKVLDTSEDDPILECNGKSKNLKKLLNSSTSLYALNYDRNNSYAKNNSHRSMVNLARRKNLSTSKNYDTNTSDSSLKLKSNKLKDFVHMIRCKLKI